MYAGRVVEHADVHALFARPFHPYTAGLLASLPRLGERRETLRTIPGQVPDPARPPRGCPFHPRCPVAIERCLEPPPTLEPAPGRTAACWRAEDIAAGVLTPFAEEARP
jgi:oligopeptide/dipeptide ABC transporter ATP-binding protein